MQLTKNRFEWDFSSVLNLPTQLSMPGHSLNSNMLYLCSILFWSGKQEIFICYSFFFLSQYKKITKKKQTKLTKSHSPSSPDQGISKFIMRENWIATQEQIIYGKAYTSIISTLRPTVMVLICKQVLGWCRKSVCGRQKVMIQITSLWTDVRRNLISILIHHHSKSKMVQLHYVHSLSWISRMQLNKLTFSYWLSASGYFFPPNLKPWLDETPTAYLASCQERSQWSCQL